MDFEKFGNLTEIRNTLNSAYAALNNKNLIKSDHKN